MSMSDGEQYEKYRADYNLYGMNNNQIVLAYINKKMPRYVADFVIKYRDYLANRPPETASTPIVSSIVDISTPTPTPVTQPTVIETVTNVLQTIASIVDKPAATQPTVPETVQIIDIPTTQPTVNTDYEYTEVFPVKSNPYGFNEDTIAQIPEHPPIQNFIPQNFIPIQNPSIKPEYLYIGGFSALFLFAILRR